VVDAVRRFVFGGERRDEANHRFARADARTITQEREVDAIVAEIIRQNEEAERIIKLSRSGRRW
jgi:hypothetical protein